MISHSYRPHQVTCLFSPFNGDLLSVQEKEACLQNGGYYGDILSKEDRPEPEYVEIFDQLSNTLSHKLAQPVLQLVEHFHVTRPAERPIVLVSLARAGTPIGVVVAELLRTRFNREVHHYSVSVLHKYGLDAHAMNHILARHAAEDVVFLDGWVSQGRITRAVEESAPQWGVSPVLYCVSDPSGFQDAVATREDVLLPSAVLNANVSGLLSRTVYNPDGFHFSETYSDFEDIDRTQAFIEEMLRACEIQHNIAPRTVRHSSQQREIARAQIEAFCARHGTDDNNIKVGVGEVSRSLLRRIPTLVVVDPSAVDETQHMFWLAQQRNIEIRVQELNGPFRAFSILS